MRHLHQLLLLLPLFYLACSSTDEKRILIFTRTEGFRHESIETGVDLFKRLGQTNGIAVDHTEDPAQFREEILQQYQVVVFLNTTGDVLDFEQQVDFERFIQAGGGFLGIHSAADTEYQWEWYGQLVGGYFQSHPAPQTAVVEVINKDHPASSFLPDRWERTDEWYNYYNLNPEVTVLARLDESSYEGGENGDNHPIAWYHLYDGGKAFYTGGGHTKEAYSEELFVQHLEGALKWLMEGTYRLDYSQVVAQRVPEENRFEVEVLDHNLYEPIELEVMDDFRVLFIERRGQLFLYDPSTASTSQVGEVDVYDKQEDGLMGLALDPQFEENNWIYLYYSPAGSEAKQHLSRFQFTNGSLDLSSEQVILEVPTQRDECCHTGGSIEFDSNGLLYLSTGDDTNPFNSHGFAPIDERPGRKPWDAQRTSGNANDLRGAILRIRVLEDGSYEIPEGNLFPPGTPGTRPEIYVMGNRNPYRISLDAKRGTLYWGEVGPDAGEDSVGFGPRGHDEVNQAKEAGFFGWPYFVANNKAYWDYDFVRGQSGEPFDPAKPINQSANNTGIQELPPAQEAFIWYPYAASEEFPMVGTGGRNAMAGPVYYPDLYDNSPHKFPDYFDGKLFIYDWIRGWVHVVTLDEAENFVRMEPFMPNHDFANPIDMQFARDGSLYVLEYGVTWYQRNEDARLIRIKYNAGNRAPLVAVSVDQEAGAVPLRVQFNSEGTIDYDNDALDYRWNFDGGNSSTDPHPVYTFEEPGVFEPSLTVTDGQGNRTTRTVRIIAGNTPPEVAIEVKGNQSFYWDNRSITYEVKVTDKEDDQAGGIDDTQVVLTKHYLAEGYDETEIMAGHQVPSQFLEGKELMDGSDCKACHQMDKASIGPSYLQIAEKYQGQADAVSYLGNKIKVGGGGVWGDQGMAAHPQLTVEQTEKIAQYILSLGEADDSRLPSSGTLVATDHLLENTRGRYYLRASYTDQGYDVVPAIGASDLITLDYHRLSPLKVDVEEGEDWGEIAGDDMIERWEDEEETFLDITEPAAAGTILSFGTVDLTEIRSIDLEGYLFGNTCQLELLIDNNTVSETRYSASGRSEMPGLSKGRGNFVLNEDFGQAEVSVRVNRSGTDLSSIALFNAIRFNPANN